MAPVRGLTIAYIDAFRGIPLLLVLLLVSGSLGAFAAEGVLRATIGIPRWFGKPDPFWYGIFAMTLTYGAYMAEVYRAGIEAVPHGQMEAARSLGMSHGQAMRHVIVPQAVRKVIPPLLNDFIALMKDTSLVSVIGFTEVVQVGRDVQSETFNSSALTLGAILFLLLRSRSRASSTTLIARQQDAIRSAGGGGPAEPAPAGGRDRSARRAGLMAESMLKLEEVRKCFGELEVLRGIDLDVGKGEVVCVLGPSGSGKSTLLRCINLLEPPDSGRILLEGMEITEGRGRTIRLDYVRASESGWCSSSSTSSRTRPRSRTSRWLSGRCSGAGRAKPGRRPPPC